VVDQVSAGVDKSSKLSTKKFWPLPGPENSGNGEIITRENARREESLPLFLTVFVGGRY